MLISLVFYFSNDSALSAAKSEKRACAIVTKDLWCVAMIMTSKCKRCIKSYVIT